VESLQDFLASDVVRGIKEMPGFTALSAKTFGVLEGPTRITHGAPVHAA
jgi:hypothetical protein